MKLFYYCIFYFISTDYENWKHISLPYTFLSALQHKRNEDCQHQRKCWICHTPSFGYFIVIADSSRRIWIWKTCCVIDPFQGTLDTHVRPWVVYFNTLWPYSRTSREHSNHSRFTILWPDVVDRTTRTRAFPVNSTCPDFGWWRF